MRPRGLIRTIKSLSLSNTARSESSLSLTTVNYFCRQRYISSSARPKVYVTRRVPEDGVTLLRKHCEVTQWDSIETVPRKELLKRVKDVDGLFFCHTDKLDAELLDAAGSQLRVISTLSVGYEHVDLAECRKRGIPVGFTPDVLTSAVAEYTVGLLLSTSRRLSQGIRAVNDGTWGTWDPLWLCGQGLDGATVGIVGLGRIGFAVAKRLVPFGVAEIQYCGHGVKPNASEIPAKFVTFDQLLMTSDFVIVCCAQNKENTGLLNAEAFKKMKRSAVFVNTSRGGMVNQDDLYDALTSGEIWGAGLDATSPEPLPTDHPLLALDNCVISPHIGSATLQTRNAMSELCAQNIIEALNGRPMPAQLKKK